MGARPRISLVLAVADNGVIGRDNRLPWHLPADLRHFKALTVDKPIVMGRLTWESLPGLLPRRRHIVVTRDAGYRAEGAEVVHSIDEALAAAGDVPEIMIVGGSVLYAEMLPRADRIYLTRIHHLFEGDAYFPDPDPQIWREIEREDHASDQKNSYSYSFITFQRV